MPYSAAYCERCSAARLEPLEIVQATQSLLADGSIDPLDPAAEAVLRRSLAFHERTG